MAFLRKTFKYLAWTFAFVLLLDAVLVLGFPRLSRPQGNADATLILGAAIFSPALYNRSLEGGRIYHEGRTPKIILSGGRISEKDMSEAKYMKKVITQKYPEAAAHLYLEENSASTYENIKNSRALLPEVKSVIVVTDEFHLARAVLLARRAGYQKVLWSAPPGNYFSRTELTYYYLREMAAMLAYIPHYIEGVK